MTIDMERLQSILESGSATVINVTDADKGRYEEHHINPLTGSMGLAEQAPYPRTIRGRLTVSEEHALVESGGGYASTPNFPDLLRQGVAFDVFSSYNETPTIWQQFAREVQSNKQQEEYLRDAGMGTAPVVHEGQDYPEAAIALDNGTIIKNYKRGYVVPVTEEMRRFDQLGKIRDIASMAGRSLRLTEDQEALNVLTTTSNYTRNSTTGDNDGGANTQTLQFTPSGLITAFNILTTMKDRKSGMYLGVRPDTLIVAPKLVYAVKQLINAQMVVRVGGNTTNDVYGTGEKNPFFGLVSNIISSPFFGSNYEWALLEKGRAVYFQRVDAPRILPPEYYPQNDTWKYFARTWFGVGMKDDRFAFFSNSTTEPAAD